MMLLCLAEVKKMLDHSEQIVQLARMLRLPMLAKYKEYTKTGATFEEGLLQLLEIELSERERKSIERKMKNAGFPIIKTIDTWVPNRLPNFDESNIAKLLTCDFIKEKRNCIAIGNSGTGKSHILIAIGVEAIRKGYTVKFKKAHQLVTEMSEAQDAKKLSKYLKALNTNQILLIDELGYLSFDTEGASLLFQVLAERYETKSTFITTNLEFSKWVDFLGDPMLSTALIDRLAHKSTFLNMKGPSYRLENAEQFTKIL